MVLVANKLPPKAAKTDRVGLGLLRTEWKPHESQIHCEAWPNLHSGELRHSTILDGFHYFIPIYAMPSKPLGSCRNSMDHREPRSIPVSKAIKAIVPSSDRRFHDVVTAGDPAHQPYYHPHFDRRSHSVSGGPMSHLASEIYKWGSNRPQSLQKDQAGSRES